MQREEFLQQLQLDYIHQHPELGALPLWTSLQAPEYFVLVTLNHGSFAAERLIPALQHLGYKRLSRHAMADRGLLVTQLAPADDGTWLVLAELQLGSLLRKTREALKILIEQTHPWDGQGQNLLCRGRPWPMPDWETFRQLEKMHPLAAWLAVMGPRLHHVGFDCDRLNSDLPTLDGLLNAAGIVASEDRYHGVLPVSTLLEYRFYPGCSRRLAFAGGDEHRLSLGGIALVQKCLSGSTTRSAQLLLPQHTRCVIG
ncbi:DUF1338 domain-containing protein [Pistricoccus aurantiacus]|uniref:DUF1338 domain-containing protein n=1 Tax=Pistricoccus aurantiacus TaxID=1883414 RepID=UPI003636A5ED